MPRTTLHRRLGALALLLAVSWLPGVAASAATAPCCSGMEMETPAEAPCHGDPAPCTSLDVAPCCSMTPAGALPVAQRECSHQTSVSFVRASAAATACITAAWTPSALVAPDASHRRLSVVLRN